MGETTAGIDMDILEVDDGSISRVSIHELNTHTQDISKPGKERHIGSQRI
jgi:hypothetical protein